MTPAEGLAGGVTPAEGLAGGVTPESLVGEEDSQGPSPKLEELKGKLNELGPNIFSHSRSTLEGVLSGQKGANARALLESVIQDSKELNAQRTDNFFVDALTFQDKDAFKNHVKADNAEVLRFDADKLAPMTPKPQLPFIGKMEHLNISSNKESNERKEFIKQAKLQNVYKFDPKKNDWILPKPAKDAIIFASQGTAGYFLYGLIASVAPWQLAVVASLALPGLGYDLLDYTIESSTDAYHSFNKDKPKFELTDLTLEKFRSLEFYAKLRFSAMVEEADPNTIPAAIQNQASFLKDFYSKKSTQEVLGFDVPHDQQAIDAVEAMKLIFQIILEAGESRHKGIDPLTLIAYCYQKYDATYEVTTKKTLATFMLDQYVVAYGDPKNQDKRKTAWDEIGANIEAISVIMQTVKEIPNIQSDQQARASRQLYERSVVQYQELNTECADAIAVKQTMQGTIDRLTEHAQTLFSSWLTGIDWDKYFFRGYEFVGIFFLAWALHGIWRRGQFEKARKEAALETHDLLRSLTYFLIGKNEQLKTFIEFWKKKSDTEREMDADTYHRIHAALVEISILRDKLDSMLEAKLTLIRGNLEKHQENAISQAILGMQKIMKEEFQRNQELFETNQREIRSWIFSPGSSSSSRTMENNKVLEENIRGMVLLDLVNIQDTNLGDYAKSLALLLHHYQDGMKKLKNNMHIKPFLENKAWATGFAPVDDETLRSAMIESYCSLIKNSAMNNNTTHYLEKMEHLLNGAPPGIHVYEEEQAIPDETPEYKKIREAKNAYHKNRDQKSVAELYNDLLTAGNSLKKIYNDMVQQLGKTAKLLNEIRKTPQFQNMEWAFDAYKNRNERIMMFRESFEQENYIREQIIKSADAQVRAGTLLNANARIHAAFSGRRALLSKVKGFGGMWRSLSPKLSPPIQFNFKELFLFYDYARRNYEKIKTEIQWKLPDEFSRNEMLQPVSLAVENYLPI